MNISPQIDGEQICTPVCSVCIANYNGETLLRECIDSVLAQGLGDQVEIIVHDDASTDASLSLLERQYPCVRVLRSERNVGFCVGNNRMAAAARGHYLLLLNNDAVLFPDAIAALIGGMGRFNDQAILSLPQFDHASGHLVDRGMLLDLLYTPTPNLAASRSEVAFVIGACLFIPRRLWNDLGAFPEWFESIAEDLYLCTVARLRGVPVRVLNESGYRHRQGASFGGNRLGPQGVITTYRRRYLSERNRLYTLLVTWPGFSVIPIALVLVLVLLLEGALLALLKRDERVWRDVYWKAISTAVVYRRQWIGSRRVVQKSRSVGFFSYAGVFSLSFYKLCMVLKNGIPRFR